MHGFGIAEMPPVIFGGKGKAKHRPRKADGVNNHWNVTEIEDFEINFQSSGAWQKILSMIGGEKDEWKT